MSDNLDTYMRGRDDRCTVCGWHPETMGHDPALHGSPVLRVPPDPMSSPEPSLLGVVGPTRTVPVRPVEDVPLPEDAPEPPGMWERADYEGGAPPVHVDAAGARQEIEEERPW